MLFKDELYNLSVKTNEYSKRKKIHSFLILSRQYIQTYYTPRLKDLKFKLKQPSARGTMQTAYVV